MGKRELVDFATKDSQLIWNRYGCMVVANSILLGFIGQLATKKYNSGWFGLCGCLIGLLIALLWLFITSYGWSLSWYTLKKSESDELKVYEEWKKEKWDNLPKDPIWLCAHLVILLFCLAYVLLTFLFSKCWLWPVAFFILLIIALIFWLKLFLFGFPLDMHKEKNMNWKQLVCMWLGIAAFVLSGIEYMYSYSFSTRFDDLLFIYFLVALVTGGLILTFKDKKPKDKEGEK